MSVEWEERFTAWAQSPSATETAKIERAIDGVRAAIAKSRLRALTKVFVQGSYRNRVNVRQESDVDIGVLYTGDTFQFQLPTNLTMEQAGIRPADYFYSQFKDEIGAALRDHFGDSAVHRGDKAFDIHANTYHVDADVVPLFEHRRYSEDGSYICGVELRPDSGGSIQNWPEKLFADPHWPEQHYENGNAKNTRTHRSYRGTVRIFKKLRVLLAEDGVESAASMPGFKVECLVWNVPDSRFNALTWDGRVQSAMSFLWTQLQDVDLCSEWGEVSELKYLFRGAGGLSRVSAFDFVNRAWDYIGGVRNDAV